MKRIQELEQRQAKLLSELAEVKRELIQEYDKACTCSSWRLSTFYGEHGADCPMKKGTSS